MNFQMTQEKILKSSRRNLLQTAVAALGFGFFGLCAVPVAAQTWPSKPVKVVVPAPAGSSLDVIVRGLGETLSKRWGQPLVVDNKPGAGGNIGSDFVAKSAGDGYTLLIASPSSISVNPALNPKLQYKPSDLLPVTLMTTSPLAASITSTPTSTADSHRRSTISA